jgi:DNA invertase Pin-like site-specific DNA recombinase
MIYGYARVSTDGQSVDAQVKQLREAGAEKIVRETASGGKTDRPGLARALKQLDKGDVLMVTRLDRLARSTRDLFNTVEDIADRRAGFRSLGDIGEKVFERTESRLFGTLWLIVHVTDAMSISGLAIRARHQGRSHDTFPLGSTLCAAR